GGSGSADIINIGSIAPSLGGTLANIYGAITITNQSGANVTLDDSADANNVTGTLDTNSITGFGLPTILDFTGSQLASLTILQGVGSNTVNINDTAASKTVIRPSLLVSTVNVLATTEPLTLDGTSGKGQAGVDINIGSTAPSLGGTLANIQGAVSVTNFSKSDLTLDDSGDSADQAGTLTATAISGFGMGGDVTYAGKELSGLKIIGGTGDVTFNVHDTSAATTLENNSIPGTFNIRATDAPLTIDGQKLAAVINVGTQAPSLTGTLLRILAPITIANTSKESNLNLDDSADTFGEAGQITPAAITGFGMSPKASINYSQNQKLAVAVHNGRGVNKITVTGDSGSIDLVGRPEANNTLIGPNKKVTWDINGVNSGSIPAINLTFSDIRHLVGGSLADTFAMMDGGSISGSIDGGTGKNALDYSGGWTGNVLVNLHTGNASGITGNKSLSNIQIVNGATGGGSGFYNILLGAGQDTLTGGDGRTNLLEAGGSGGTLQGGDQNDILIGGTTTYDKQVDAHSFIAIMALWSTSTQSYASLVTAINTGAGVPALSKKTAHNSGKNITLLAHNGSTLDLNLYFGAALTQPSDLDSAAGEQFILI
ncbi:MAG TPA: hypothetical protein VGN88_01365, partial [Phycisphaerae bacterium]